MPPVRFDRGVRRIALWGLTTLSTVALLMSYRTSTSSVMPAATGTPTTTTVGTGASAATPRSTYTGTVTGSTTDTRWGPVQVRLTVAAGHVTAVDVVQQSDGNHRDQEINADAVPTLVQETLEAQSADIDMVSGATVTSDGYVASLQNALDQAGLA